MTRRLSMFVVAAILYAALPASAMVGRSDHYDRFASLDMAGEVWVENPIGNIEIIGTESAGLKVSATKITNGIDEQALKEGLMLTVLRIEGDARVRVVRTMVPSVGSDRWNCDVHYVLQVPRTVHVKVNSYTSQLISITNITGNVTVKNVNGEIRLNSVVGATTVRSINGNITASFASRLHANTDLSTVNGRVLVYVPEDANFEWVGDSIKGDFFTSMPARVKVAGTSLHGSVNNSGGPTLTTSSVMESVYILKIGTQLSDAHSVKAQRSANTALPPAAQPSLGIEQHPYIKGNWTYATSLGDVEVGQADGSVRIETGAGRVELHTIRGSCNVSSGGGPLDLGDIFGPLYAHTRAGEIVVRAARAGGTVMTDGGTIHLVYSGGPVTLRSGGGDIVLHQAFGAVDAETKSGDVNISLDPRLRTARLTIGVKQGNSILNLPANFGADLDLTITTSEADRDTVDSEFPGLVIQREQFGSKVRFHATGKINGGGETVDVHVEEGSIHLKKIHANPISAPIR